MPATVKIGCKTIDVKVEDKPEMSGEPRMGLCSWHYSLIELDKHQSSHEMVNTLIHEVLHLHCRRASAEQFDDFRKIEEYCVNLMANVICETIVDNPKLIEWMVNTLKRKEEGLEEARKHGPKLEEE